MMHGRKFHGHVTCDQPRSEGLLELQGQAETTSMAGQLQRLLRLRQLGFHHSFLDIVTLGASLAQSLFLAYGLPRTREILIIDSSLASYLALFIQQPENCTPKASDKAKYSQVWQFHDFASASPRATRVSSSTDLLSQL
jgi:hypothetical protein